MTKILGRQLSVGIAKEAVRGTAVASSYWLNVLSFSHQDKANKARVEPSFGHINAMGDAAYVTRRWAEGEIEAELGDKSFGLILLALLGAVQDSSTGGAYKHTYTMLDSVQHQSLTIHTDDPIGDYVFTLAMIDSLSIKIVPDEIVKFTVSFKSKNSSGESTTASYTAENKFLGRHLSFKVGATTAALAAATKISLKSLTLEFEKNANVDPVLGTAQPEDVTNGAIGIKGSLELNYEDRTWHDYMLDGTYKAIRIDLKNEDATVGSTNPEFLIDLSKVDFDSWEPAYGLDDLVTQKIEFNALYDLGGNGNVINDCFIINSVASY